jgi:hypothetical protein
MRGRSAAFSFLVGCLKCLILAFLEARYETYKRCLRLQDKRYLDRRRRAFGAHAESQKSWGTTVEVQGVTGTGDRRVTGSSI